MAKSYSPEIVKAVEEFFTKEELNYFPCNENGVIRSGMMLSSQIHRVDIYMDIRKDGYSMISVFPLHAEEKARPAIAEFLTRANYEINLGCFDMDFEDGEIRYKMAQFCGATVPTYEQIQKIFYVAITTINHYGNGIAKTLLSLGTPKENLAECHQEPKKQ